MWIDKLEYRQRKIEYYDAKTSLLKTLVFRDYRSISTSTGGR